MSKHIRVKICGITSLADRDLVAREGADFFGVVVGIPYSPRSLDVGAAAPLFQDPPTPGAVLFLDRSEDDIVRAASILKPFAVQLQGLEPPELVASLKQKFPSAIWKALHLPAQESEGKSDSEPELLDKLLKIAQEHIDAGVDLFIVDTVSIEPGLVRRGGTGKVSNWALAAKLVADLSRSVLLAGGIRPRNVAEAIRQVRPFGVDLASGVESSPGKKDPKLVRQLMQAVRQT